MGSCIVESALGWLFRATEEDIDLVGSYLVWVG